MRSLTSQPLIDLSTNLNLDAYYSPLRTDIRTFRIKKTKYIFFVNTFVICLTDIISYFKQQYWFFITDVLMIKIWSRKRPKRPLGSTDLILFLGKSN